MNTTSRPGIERSSDGRPGARSMASIWTTMRVRPSPGRRTVAWSSSVGSPRWGWRSSSWARPRSRSLCSTGRCSSSWQKRSSLPPTGCRRMDFLEAALAVMREEGKPLHWTAIQDLALRRGYLDPFTQRDIRQGVVGALARAAREGLVVKAEKGVYSLPEEAQEAGSVNERADSFPRQYARTRR